MIVSVIMFKLKERTDENIAAIQGKLLAMKENIEQLQDIKIVAGMPGGPNSFDVIMIAKYNSMQDFNRYISHSFHVGVGEYVQNVCEKTASICYEE